MNSSGDLVHLLVGMRPGIACVGNEFGDRPTLNEESNPMGNAWEIYALRYATMSPRTPHMNYLSPDPHETTAADLDYFVWLIRGEGREIVVDTGFSAAMAAKRGREHIRCPTAALRALGCDASKVRDVVITHLHYDHVGSGCPPAGNDTICNGADDDGSGTTALLGMAEALAKAPARPKRSVLFVWHCGEEKGLWGSRYFTEYPTVPLNQITAKAQALGDIRITQPGAEKKLEAALQNKIASGKLIPDTETTLKVEVGRPAFLAGEKGAALGAKAQAIYKEIDRELGLAPMTGGGTDAGFAGRSGKATVLESFGLAGFGYHAKDEYIEVDSIVPRLYLVTRLLTEIGKQ